MWYRLCYIYSTIKPQKLFGQWAWTVMTCCCVIYSLMKTHTCLWTLCPHSCGILCGIFIWLSVSCMDSVQTEAVYQIFLLCWKMLGCTVWGESGKNGTKLMYCRLSCLTHTKGALADLMNCLGFVTTLMLCCWAVAGQFGGGEGNTGCSCEASMFDAVWNEW